MRLATWLIPAAGALALSVVALPAQSAPGGLLEGLKGPATEIADVQQVHRRYRRYRHHHHYRYYRYRPGIYFHFGPRRHHHYHRRHWY